MFNCNLIPCHLYTFRPLMIQSFYVLTKVKTEKLETGGGPMVLILANKSGMATNPSKISRGKNT